MAVSPVQFVISAPAIAPIAPVAKIRRAVKKSKTAEPESVADDAPRAQTPVASSPAAACSSATQEALTKIKLGG